MDKFKGFYVPEHYFDRIDVLSGSIGTTLSRDCANFLTRNNDWSCSGIKCKDCVFEKVNGVLDEWYNKQLREKKLERIINE